MARKRMIASSLPTSESVARMSIPARCAWPYLWIYLDDYGRGIDNLALLKAALWPLDPKIREKHVDAQLDEMVGEQLVCRYTAPDGRRCLHVPHEKWKAVQQIAHRSDSKVAPCPVHDADLTSIGDPQERLRMLSGRTREAFCDSAVEFSEVESSSGDSGASADCATDLSSFPVLARRAAS